MLAVNLATHESALSTISRRRSSTVRLNVSWNSLRFVSALPRSCAEPGVGTMVKASCSSSVVLDMSSEEWTVRSTASGRSTSYVLTRGSASSIVSFEMSVITMKLKLFTPESPRSAGVTARFQLLVLLLQLPAHSPRTSVSAAWRPSGLLGVRKASTQRSPTALMSSVDVPNCSTDSTGESARVPFTLRVPGVARIRSDGNATIALRETTEIAGIVSSTTSGVKIWYCGSGGSRKVSVSRTPRTLCIVISVRRSYVIASHTIRFQPLSSRPLLSKLAVSARNGTEPWNSTPGSHRSLIRVSVSVGRCALTWPTFVPPTCTKSSRLQQGWLGVLPPPWSASEPLAVA